MAKSKIISPKLFFKILYLYEKKGLNLTDIYNTIEEKVSYATISRICKNSIGGHKLYVIWKKTLIENSSEY